MFSLDRFTIRAHFLLAAVAVCCAACGVKPGTVAAKKSVPPIRPRVDQAAKAITEEDCQLFAQQLEVAATQTATDLHALIDWPGLLDRALQGLDSASPFAKGFRIGAERLSDYGFEHVVCQSVANGGELKFLHVQVKNGLKRPLFRFRSESGVNYFVFSLEKVDDGKLRADDAYVFATGEPLSQTVRRAYLAASAEPGLLDRLTGKENAFLRSVESIKKMRAANQEGRPQEALAIYRQLPEDVQHGKSVQLVRIQASLKIGDEEYAAALAEYRKTFPHDGASDLLSIDYYLLRKDFASARECIDRLDVAVGGDPYLELLRAQIYLSTQEPLKASECMERAIAAEPTLVSAYDMRLGAALDEQDHPATLIWLQKYANQFHIRFEDLRQLPRYAEFVKSDEFQQWLEFQPPDDAMPADGTTPADDPAAAAAAE